MSTSTPPSLVWCLLPSWDLRTAERKSRQAVVTYSLLALVPTAEQQKQKYWLQRSLWRRWVCRLLCCHLLRQSSTFPNTQPGSVSPAVWTKQSGCGWIAVVKLPCQQTPALPWLPGFQNCSFFRRSVGSSDSNTKWQHSLCNSGCRGLTGIQL